MRRNKNFSFIPGYFDLNNFIEIEMIGMMNELVLNREMFMLRIGHARFSVELCLLKCIDVTEPRALLRRLKYVLCSIVEIDEWTRSR